MLSCENMIEEGCPVEMVDENILRQMGPYSTLMVEEYQRLLQSEDNFVPSPLGKTKALDILHGGLAEEEKTAITVGHATTRQVCGSELNEAPAKYELPGLLPHELPVIGLYVDPLIRPGFRYKVRYNGRDEALYNGEAKTLLSIGMGYGKRLTFQGDSPHNFNENYFWSDSDPKGFAFSLDVVSEGDEFIIYNLQSEPVGKVRVESVNGHQSELSEEIRKGSVVKTVRVVMTCSVDYYQRHQLLDLHSHDLETIEGEVMIEKQKRARKANLLCIKNVNFSRQGACTLQVD